MAGSRLSELAYFLYLTSLISSAAALTTSTQTVGGQCGGKNWHGLTKCATTAYCATSNFMYAACSPYSTISTTVTSGNSLFTTTVTTDGYVVYSVVDPEGAKTVTSTIAATATPFTHTVQATGTTSGTVIIGSPSAKSTSSSAKSSSTSSSSTSSTSASSSSTSSTSASFSSTSSVSTPSTSTSSTSSSSTSTSSTSASKSTSSVTLLSSSSSSIPLTTSSSSTSSSSLTSSSLSTSVTSSALTSSSASSTSSSSSALTSSSSLSTSSTSSVLTSSASLSTSSTSSASTASSSFSDPSTSSALTSSSPTSTFSTSSALTSSSSSSIFSTSSALTSSSSSSISSTSSALTSSSSSLSTSTSSALTSSAIPISSSAAILSSSSSSSLTTSSTSNVSSLVTSSSNPSSISSAITSSSSSSNSLLLVTSSSSVLPETFSTSVLPVTSSSLVSSTASAQINSTTATSASSSGAITVATVAGLYTNSTQLTNTTSAASSTVTPFQLYTASVCASGSTSATPAATAPATAQCGVSGSAISPVQQLTTTPYHIIPDPKFCAQLCLNTASCESFALNTISGSITSDCYLFNSTTTAQNLASANSSNATAGNATYYDATCYSCTNSVLSVSELCSGSTVTPDCYRALYQIPESFLSVDGVTFGVMEVAANVYEQSDLDYWWANYAEYIPAGYGPNLVSINGGQTGNASDGGSNPELAESAIDFQCAIPLTFPQVVDVYQVDPGNVSWNAGAFDHFLDAVDSSFCAGNGAQWDGSSTDITCGAYVADQVISISYSGDEAQYTTDKSDDQISFNYVNRQCMEYLKLGLMGTTVLVSTGDFGVAGYGGRCAAFGPAEDYDPYVYYLDDNNGYWTPQFPATCPYVVAVGATQLGSNNGLPEVAAQWSDGFGNTVSGSGGFSNAFPMPSYQQAAVQAYWDGGYAPADPNGVWTYSSQAGYPIYNNSQTTRGFPDISANGNNWQCYLEGDATCWGTSLSTPLIASMFTLVNQQRALVGKGPVGFVNPALYANAGIFNDVTEGCSGGCGTDGYCSAPGWDPVTGLGTVTYPALLELYMSLP